MNENAEETTETEATEKQKSIKAKIKTIIISFVSGLVAAFLFIFKHLHNNRSGINTTRSEQQEINAASGRIEERSGDIETISRENAKIFEKIRNRKKDN